MIWNGLQRRTLQINLARDRAETVLAELRELQAADGGRPDSADGALQRQVGELALRRAITAAERTVDHLNDALRTARREVFQ
ncbi:MAG: hypothetical protein ACOCTI_03040, partial [Phycisphaeraceae bacterium]